MLFWGVPKLQGSSNLRVCETICQECGGTQSGHLISTQGLIDKVYLIWLCAVAWVSLHTYTLDQLKKMSFPAIDFVLLVCFGIWFPDHFPGLINLLITIYTMLSFLTHWTRAGLRIESWYTTFWLLCAINIFDSWKWLWHNPILNPVTTPSSSLQTYLWTQ